MTSSRSLGLAGVLLAIGVLLSGCATVDSRIAKNRAEYETWSLAVREKVAAGRIDLGFTAQQVAVALGEPDRGFTRTTSDGTSQVWSYRDRGPRFGIGIGVGLGSWSSRRGGSFGTIGIGTGGGYQDDEKLGVVFDETGRVRAIETRGK
jgi:hypothetical protein